MAKWSDDDGWGETGEYSWVGESDSIPPYQRIMVVIDDTPSMAFIVRHAIRLAILSSAEVDFLALPIIPAAAAMPDMLTVTNDVIDGLMLRNQALLDSAVEAAVHAGVACRSFIRWGRLPGIILHLADETQCDLIIVGTSAKTGWLRLIQPCIARQVALQARQPVLVI